MNNLENVPTTPALVFSHDELCETATNLRRVAEEAGCLLLYSIKACSNGLVLEQISKYLDGFACSSLFELELASQYVGPNHTLHVCSPVLSELERRQLSKGCDYLVLNSVAQASLALSQPHSASLGLRVNPKTQFVTDSRYDPCRSFSKLGVNIEGNELSNVHKLLGNGISGLHVHNNSDSSDLLHLLETVRVLEAHLGKAFQKLTWINLGGGYLYSDCDENEFIDAIRYLRDRFCGDVFIEPGATLVRNSGYLVSTILDIVNSDGKKICILDTSVNHWPEVFEYQFSPDVIGASDDGQYLYILAGRSCLAGDLFGEYRFSEPLEIGDRIVLSDAGAYSIAKESWFNGINLPDVYMYSDGKYISGRSVGITEYLQICGAQIDAPLRKRA